MTSLPRWWVAARDAAAHDAVGAPLVWAPFQALGNARAAGAPLVARAGAPYRPQRWAAARRARRGVKHGRRAKEAPSRRACEEARSRGGCGSGGARRRAVSPAAMGGGEEAAAWREARAEGEGGAEPEGVRRRAKPRRLHIRWRAQARRIARSDGRRRGGRGVAQSTGGGRRRRRAGERAKQAQPRRLRVRWRAQARRIARRDVLYATAGGRGSSKRVGVRGGCVGLSASRSASVAPAGRALPCSGKNSADAIAHAVWTRWQRADGRSVGHRWLDVVPTQSSELPAHWPAPRRRRRLSLRRLWGAGGKGAAPLLADVMNNKTSREAEGGEATEL